MKSLLAAAHTCLAAASPDDKPARTFEAAAAFARGELSSDGELDGPEPIRMPGRPATPKLVHPRDLPKRGFGSIEGRAAFIHAVAHIEFNAIDLAWDAVYRFRGMPDAYYADWIAVANDEARHFEMLRARLKELGHDYGDFGAHNGLWEMAEKTAGSGLARMALVPRVLEARGLDVTPVMLDRVRASGDEGGARLLSRILDDEIRHVRFGATHFDATCRARGASAEILWKSLVERHFRGGVKPPFNDSAREAAGLSRTFYATLA